MKNISLAKRETHNYTSAWKHLDRWSDIGEASVVAFGDESDPDSNGEAGSGWSLVRIDRLEPDFTVQDAIEALADEYSYGCKCEHDCCGHRFGGANGGQVVGELDGKPLVRMATWWALNI